ncbi:phage baseplate assembly protein [Pseudomonas chlororaphis]|uniref:phage baseplate assembly protein n=1 Tax=Pseudomonas chlororaphis TaxID=587753 RepID=UPI001B301BB8|nr:phage tail protein [Pseudomonas chlororaphis]MBP5056337.1 phage tail protein [Pseudomonas chlororaphis]MBP5143097.1 phage tail protein [Pseudomonas chlororaphis]QTU03973.1 phage tail protein [Pseudomonas chlororaphis]
MPNEAQNEEIRLSIGGLTHETWDGWSVESDLLTPSDGFELELYTKDATRLPSVLAEGAPCSLTLGKDRVLTGQVDEFEHDISRQGIFMRITGRDRAAPLVDCSAPFVAMREASLSQILDQVVKPLGIDQVEIRAANAKTRRRIQIEPGQTAWEALLQVAESNGLWPWVEPDGRLVVGGPDYNAAPVATLVMREDGVGNNVERLSVRRSIANRYSQITVLGQHGQYDNDGLDTKRSHLKSVIQDETLARRGIFRPKVIIDSASESQDMATTRARKLLADSRLEGFEIRAIVDRHRADNGQVWTPGQRITVRSEPHGLDAVYFLMSSTLRVTRSEGCIAELRLREDKMWVLDGNPTKKRKGKKADPDAALIELYKGL